MQSPNFHTLHAVCKRYGPGQFPKADRHDIGAGYAAAAAAFVATILYGTIISTGAVLGMGWDGAVNLLFATFALPFVVPAAFLVGVIGWRILLSYTSVSGLLAGGFGALATYLVTFVLVGILLTVTAVLSLSGAKPVNAALLSVGLVSVAFVLTWWVTIPIGCLAGYVYVNAVGEGNNRPANGDIAS